MRSAPSPSRTIWSASWRSSVVERLAEPQLVLGLRIDDDAARPARHQDRGVVRRQLAVDADAVERALDADAEQQVGGLGLSAASVWTKHSIVAKFGWIIPAPLACALSRTAARRQRDVEREPLLERVGGRDRAPEGGVAVAAQLAAGGEDPLDRSRRVERDADDAGRRDRDLVLAAPRPPSRRRPASSRRRPARAGRWPRSRCPRWRRRRAARRAGSAPGHRRPGRRARRSA